MVVTCNWGLEARTDQWAYRVILILQFFIPFLMISGGLFLPDSPRWLIQKGKEHEALAVDKFLQKGKPETIIEHEAQLLVA